MITREQFSLLYEPIVLMTLDDFEARRAMLLDDGMPQKYRLQRMCLVIGAIMDELWNLCQRPDWSPRWARTLARYRTLQPDCYVPLVLE